MFKLALIFLLSTYLFFGSIVTANENNKTKLTVIHTEAAPKAIGTYSQAIQVNNLVFLSGQIGIAANQSVLVSDDFELQAQQVLKNLEAVCEASGGSLNDIAKITVYLTDLSNFGTLNKLMEKSFAAPYPARATVEVKQLPKQAKIEIDAIMVL